MPQPLTRSGRTTATLPGPSRTIVVEPIESPREEPNEPEPPAREAPDRPVRRGEPEPAREAG